MAENLFENVLNTWLSEGGGEIEAQIIFTDGSMSGGKVRNGPWLGMYTVTQPAAIPDGRGGVRVIEGKGIELYFTGAQIARLARKVDLETSGLVTPPGAGRIVTP